MFTRAVVVADESATPEVSEVVEALRAACGPECEITELIDAPIRSMLTGIDRVLRASGPTQTTLVLFCGDVARGLDDHLYYTCVADDPTPMNAVLVDVLIEMLTAAQTRVVTVFDCVMEERDEFARDPIRVLERGFGSSSVSAFIADASMEGVGGVARLLADGLVSTDADLDDDGVISVGELFGYIERRSRAAGVPADAIVVTGRRSGTPIARLGGYEPGAVDDRVSARTELQDLVEEASEAVTNPETDEAAAQTRRRTPLKADPVEHASPRGKRKRRVRVIAAVGAITVAGLAVFGGIARSIASDDAPARSTVTTAVTYTADGSVALPETCTNVPTRLEITVDATKVPANLTIAAVTHLDDAPETTSVLERVADPTPGDGLYVAPLGPFDHPGTLSWRLLLNNPLTIKNVSMRCGGNLPSVTSTTLASSAPSTLTTTSAPD
jgi:hypothetical protein